MEKGTEELPFHLGHRKPGIGEADLIDVFREAANVIAGNLLAAVALDSSVVLGVPVAQRLQASSELKTVPGITFNIDGEFFRLAVQSSSS